MRMHVVFGGGPLGIAVLRELNSRGLSARLVTRSGKPASATKPAPYDWVSGDAADPQSARRACVGASVVYHCAGLPYEQWADLFPRMMEGIIAGAQAAGAKLVYGDNLYMYGKVGGPMTEDTPYRPNSVKGQVRAQVAERLLAAHANGNVRATIGRGSSFFGPGVLMSHVGDRLFPPALSGGTAVVLGNPGNLHTFTYIDDFGKALVLLGERDEALGKAWHVPSPETLTHRAFIGRVYRLAGTKGRVLAIPRWLLSLLGLYSPLLREAKETLYQFEDDFVMDSSRYTATFGASATPLDQAIRNTLEWYRSHYKR